MLSCKIPAVTRPLSLYVRLTCRTADISCLTINIDFILVDLNVSKLTVSTGICGNIQSAITGIFTVCTRINATPSISIRSHALLREIPGCEYCSLCLSYLDIVEIPTIISLGCINFTSVCRRFDNDSCIIIHSRKIIPLSLPFPISSCVRNWLSDYCSISFKLNNNLYSIGSAATNVYTPIE